MTCPDCHALMKIAQDEPLGAIYVCPGSHWWTYNFKTHSLDGLQPPKGEVDG